ncbi:MAG TPA: hypothetical protein VMX17_17095 [Candidatus Glassbacteria bacterium]|nr:hypothetical protein [Candidatus Glassbacteria bacterium]
MIINCPKCHKMADMKLNPKTDEVVCDSCNNVVPNMTGFIKTTLRANKEFVKKSNTKQPFSVKCNNCGKEVKADNNMLCPECGKEITVSRFFINAIKNRR